MEKIFYIAIGLALLGMTIIIIGVVIVVISELGILPGMFVAIIFGGLAIAEWSLLIEMFLDG